jgi:hypothetical protein
MATLFATLVHELCLDHFSLEMSPPQPPQPPVSPSPPPQPPLLPPHKPSKPEQLFKPIKCV